MRIGTVYFTHPNGKRYVRSVTYALNGGGFLHFDKVIQPIRKPFSVDLTEVPPLTVTPTVAKKLRAGKPRSTAGHAESKPSTQKTKP